MPLKSRIVEDMKAAMRAREAAKLSTIRMLLAAITIGVVSVALSLLGLELGRVLGSKFGQRGELLGGIVLIIVGIAITAELL